MQSPKWPLYASALLLAGGVSWLVKIAVIVATDGRVITAGAAALLMSGGVVLLPLGAAGIGAWLARRTHVILRAVAALGAVAALAACTAALGWGATALVRGHGPGYAEQEVGVLAAGLVWSGVGAAALARFRRTSATSAASPAMGRTVGRASI